MIPPFWRVDDDCNIEIYIVTLGRYVPINASIVGRDPTPAIEMQTRRRELAALIRTLEVSS